MVSINKDHLSEIVNGLPTSELKDRPWDYYTSDDRIKGSWTKVGAVPLTRVCLQNVGVRHTEEAGDPLAGRLTELRCEHQKRLAEARTGGLNVDALEVTTAPPKPREPRAPTLAGRLQNLANKPATNASSLWHTVGAAAINSREILAIDQERARMELEAAAAAEAREAAGVQAALQDGEVARREAALLGADSNIKGVLLKRLLKAYLPVGEKISHLKSVHEQRARWVQLRADLPPLPAAVQAAAVQAAAAAPAAVAAPVVAAPTAAPVVAAPAVVPAQPGIAPVQQQGAGGAAAAGAAVVAGGGAAAVGGGGGMARQQALAAFAADPCEATLADLNSSWQ